MKKYIAEFLGTLLIVFIGAGAICADHTLKMAGGHGADPTWTIAVFGVVIVAIVYATSYISGSHINPAVTISFWIIKKINTNKAVFYIISQLLGAVIAACCLRILFPDAVSTVYLGTCVLGEGVGFWKASLIEFILTFLFVFTIYATAVDMRASKILAGVAIGLVYLFGMLVSTTITGGAFNPARVFGPAMVSGHFDSHFIWWLGPISGGIAAGFLYKKIFTRKANDQEVIIGKM